MKKQIAFVGTLISITVLTGCKADPIRTYQVPKQVIHIAKLQDAGALQWSSPKSWVQEKAGNMIDQQFRLPGDAVFTVASFPGNVGGLLSNVNRWRGQLGLEPTTLKKVQSMVEESQTQTGLPFRRIYLENSKEQALHIAILPFGGKTFFFKLTGSKIALAKNHGAFIRFLEEIYVKNT